MKTEPNDLINPIQTSIQVGELRHPFEYESIGLSKREYFASMAMIALSNNKEIKWKNELEKIAQNSVVLADCLIEKLNKKQTTLEETTFEQTTLKKNITIEN